MESFHVQLFEPLLNIVKILISRKSTMRNSLFITQYEYNVNTYINQIWSISFILFLFIKKKI